jgi:hypothetical protein
MYATPRVFVTLVALLFLYEIVAIWENQGNTISEIVWFVTKTHPLLAFGFGLLMGHFFWQAERIWKGQC